MVSFRWFWKNQFGRGLTSRAKQYLSLVKSGTSKEQAERIVTGKVEKIIEEQVKKNLRTQKVLNSSYSISLRAIGFDKTEEDLDDAITEFINSNTWIDNIPFESEGFEEELIGVDEDKGLRKEVVTVELNVRGQTTYTEI